ncbi:hypothetical protein [Flavobacterium sp. ACAM 123]|uniref:hypothetical protein n=1 Tax=Flavobacterium sp. ACAM 123 TaxID=1189620 RepID=UPI0002E48430|nr:hypothetical protein [Flavobacterium sp. ACAM 123]
MIAHRVKYFDAWLKVYDAEELAKRTETGLIDNAMARNIDDPNVEALVFTISDIDKTKAIVNSEEQKKLMMEAGVEGATEMFYYKLID